MYDKDSLISILAGDGEDAQTWFWDELADAWRAAQAEAVLAYEAWRDSASRAAYAVYRAAQDRADQAQDVLAARALGQAA